MRAGLVKVKVQEVLGLDASLRAEAIGPKTRALIEKLANTPNDAEWGAGQILTPQPVSSSAVARVPADTEDDIRAVYGPPGDSQLTSMELPYPMRIAWDTGVVVNKITCHKFCVKDLTSILRSIQSHYGTLREVQRARMDLYGGMYNYRKMRGGTSWSRHAWGIAIDLDPDQNGLHDGWPHGEATMPTVVIDIFEAHGWKSYARSIGRDAMHFQRTK